MLCLYHRFSINLSDYFKYWFWFLHSVPHIPASRHSEALLQSRWCSSCLRTQCHLQEKNQTCLTWGNKKQAKEWQTQDVQQTQPMAMEIRYFCTTVLTEDDFRLFMFAVICSGFVLLIMYIKLPLQIESAIHSNLMCTVPLCWMLILDSKKDSEKTTDPSSPLSHCRSGMSWTIREALRNVELLQMLNIVYRSNFIKNLWSNKL